jgi:hypothetical protein
MLFNLILILALVVLAVSYGAACLWLLDRIRHRNP